MKKQALHSHDRGHERLKLDRASVDMIQRAVDDMWYRNGHKKLVADHYHTRITDQHNNLMGYAALKRINKEGRRPRLILASILGKEMHPRGQDISYLVNTNVKKPS